MRVTEVIVQVVGPATVMTAPAYSPVIVEGVKVTVSAVPGVVETAVPNVPVVDGALMDACCPGESNCALTVELSCPITFTARLSGSANVVPVVRFPCKRIVPLWLPQANVVGFAQ